MSPLEMTQTAPLTLWEDGSIRIGSSRIPIDSIVQEFNCGATAEQIQDDFPTLTLREIYGAISYYLEHQSRVDDYLERREQDAAQVRLEVENPTRAEVLRRRIREQRGKSSANR